MSRIDFEDIRENWRRLLDIAGIRVCVDNYRVGEDSTGYNHLSEASACKNYLTADRLKALFKE